MSRDYRIGDVVHGNVGDSIGIAGKKAPLSPRHLLVPGYWWNGVSATEKRKHYDCTIMGFGQSVCLQKEAISACFTVLQEALALAGADAMRVATARRVEPSMIIYG